MFNKVHQGLMDHKKDDHFVFTRYTEWRDKSCVHVVRFSKHGPGYEYDGLMTDRVVTGH